LALLPLALLLALPRWWPRPAVPAEGRSGSWRRQPGARKRGAVSLSAHRHIGAACHDVPGRDVVQQPGWMGHRATGAWVSWGCDSGLPPVGDAPVVFRGHLMRLAGW